MIRVRKEKALKVRARARGRPFFSPVIAKRCSIYYREKYRLRASRNVSFLCNSRHLGDIFFSPAATDVIMPGGAA